MNILRRPIRLTVEHGAKMYATVEDVVYGLATVRLSTGGARLTQLPILGASVKTGDKVMVDYSAEGLPAVRPLTIPPVETELTVSEATVQDEEETDLIYTANEICRVTISEEQWIDVHSSSIAVVFDQIVFDPTNMFSGSQIKAKSPGRYLVRFTIAIAPPTEYVGISPLITAIAKRTLGSGGYSHDGATRKRWGPYPSINPTILGNSAILTLKPGEEVRLFLDFNFTSGSGHQYRILKEDGKYPILEAWKICGISSAETAPVGWYHYD